MSATKSLTSQAKQLNHAFSQDIGDTAASVGRGEDYTKAMTMYRRGSQLEGAAKGVLKYGGRAALGAAGAEGLYKLGRSLNEK